MYAVNGEGQLELELGDWKDNRKYDTTLLLQLLLSYTSPYYTMYYHRYRIMAIDHDLLSFTDYQYKTWPVILITNPKDARFSAPAHEPSLRILHSTHIRYIIVSIVLTRI